MAMPKGWMPPRTIHSYVPLQSGKARPLFAFVMLPIIGLIASNLISFVAYDFNSLPVVFVFMVSVGINYLAFGPVLNLIVVSAAGETEGLRKPDLKRLSYEWEKHAAEYFTKRGEQNAIVEIEYMTRILYVAIAILIALLLLYFTDLLNHEYLEVIVGQLQPVLGVNFVLRATGILSAYVALQLVFMTEFYITREFRFYFANACIRVASFHVSNEVEKMKFLILGLDSYNKYLRRNLKQQFDENRVNSLIIAGKMESTINNLVEAFVVKIGQARINKLGPVVVLSDMFADKSEFLTKERFGQEILDWGGLLAGLIPVAITILTLMRDNKII